MGFELIFGTQRCLRGSGTKWLFFALAGALVLRLGVALILPPEYRFTDDAVEYVAVAHNLLDQGIFGEVRGVPYATIPPGYPVFLAGVLWVSGGSLQGIRIAQVCLGVIMVWLLHMIGGYVASKRVGALAASVLAVYPPWVIWPSLYLTETLFTTVLLALVLGLLQLQRSPSWKLDLTTGGILGLVTLVRELMAPFVLFVPLVLMWAGMRWATILKVTALVAMAMVVTLSPWVYRNSATFGAPFLSERIEAVRFRITGNGYLAPRYQYLANSASPAPVRRPEAFRRRFGDTPSALLSVGTTISSPREYLGHLGRRIQRLWLHPVGLVSVPGGRAGRVGYLGLHLVVLFLAGVGFGEGMYRRDAGLGVLLVVVLFGSAVILLVAWPHPRYSLPFVPLVLVAAAHGSMVFARWRAASQDSL